MSERERRLWREASDSVKRKPNKYARTLRAVTRTAAALCAIVALMLTVFATVFGSEAVLSVIGGPEFLYGTVMRGIILLSMALFAGWLLAGWTDETEN